MPHGGILQSDPQVVCTQQACRNVPAQGRRDVKLGRSRGFDLVRDERSRLFVYAFIEKRKRVQDSIDPIYSIDIMRGGSNFVSSISSVKIVEEYTRYPIST